MKDSEIAPIEAKITTQVESYQQKLQQYEQAYIKATLRKNYPNEVTRKQLQQTWQTLGLSEIDVETIESRLSAEIKTHQENLRQYEQIFSEAVQQEYPLSSINRDKLTERYRSLNLTVEDVEAIEHPIVVEIEEHQQKLQQYEQVFRESVQFEYPLSDTTRNELQRFQQVLDLSDDTISAIEQQVIETLQLLQGIKLSLLDDQGVVSNPTLSDQVSIPEQNQLILQEDQLTLLSSATKTTNDNSPQLLEKKLVGKNAALNPSLSSIFSTKKNRVLFYIFLSLISGIWWLVAGWVRQTQREIAFDRIAQAQLLQANGQFDQCIDILANARNYGDQDIMEEQNRLRDQCQKSINDTNGSANQSSSLDDSLQATIEQSGPFVITPDSQTLITLDKDGKSFQFFNLSGQSTQIIEAASTGGYNSIGCLAISPDGRTLVAGHSDNTVSVWDLDSKKLVRTLTGERGRQVRTVTISSDGKTLAAGGTSHTIRVWNLKTGELRKTLEGHVEVSSLDINLSSNILVSGSPDKTIKIWNIETGELIRTITAPSYVFSVAISPDGKSIAGAIGDGIVKIWTLDTGELLRTLETHSAVVWSVAFSPNGRTLVSGGSGIKIWDLENGKVIDNQTGAMWESVGISPDGKLLVGQGQPAINTRIKIWKLQ